MTCTCMRRIQERNRQSIGVVQVVCKVYNVRSRTILHHHTRERGISQDGRIPLWTEDVNNSSGSLGCQMPMLCAAVTPLHAVAFAPGGGKVTRYNQMRQASHPRTKAFGGEVVNLTGPGVHGLQRVVHWLSAPNYSEVMGGYSGWRELSGGPQANLLRNAPPSIAVPPSTLR